MPAQTFEMSVNPPCSVRLEKESLTYVSECLPLNVMSAGETEHEAIQAIQSAVVMYLQSAAEDGCLGEILNERGFRFTQNPQEISRAEHFISLRVSNDADERVFPIKVPIGLLVGAA